MPNIKLQYADLALDRCDQYRTDQHKLQQLWQQQSTRFCVMQNQHNLILSENPNSAKVALLSRDALKELIPKELPSSGFAFLGIAKDGSAFFGLLINDDSVEQILSINSDYQFIDIRQVGNLLDNTTASIAAYARGVLYWQQQNPFCNRCGSTRQLIHGGHSLKCTNQDCQHILFPRIEPAVIMLIESQDKDGKPICLLGRSANWPVGTYSTLAGFVEIGESLEDAVRRESYEEAGVQIGDVEYIAAQPWPFPSSIMLGFRAKAITTELKLDPNEIEDAQWFTLEQILQFGTWGDDTHSGYKMPRTDSIARHLIDLWVSEQKKIKITNNLLSAGRIEHQPEP